MSAKLSWKKRLANALLRGKFTVSDQDDIGHWCNCMSSEFDYPSNANYPKGIGLGWYPDIGKLKGSYENVSNLGNKYSRMIALGSGVTGAIRNDRVSEAVAQYYALEEEAVRLGLVRI